MHTELRFTDLFPTRYEAFETPGVCFIFRPADDGTFWHGTRDESRSQIADFIAPKQSELAVYHTDTVHFEVSARRQAYSVAECRIGPADTVHFEVSDSRGGFLVRLYKDKADEGRTIHADSFLRALVIGCAESGLPGPFMPGGWDGLAWFERKAVQA